MVTLAEDGVSFCLLFCRDDELSYDVEYRILSNFPPCRSLEAFQAHASAGNMLNM